MIAPRPVRELANPLVLEHMDAASRAEARGSWGDALAEYERAFYLLPSGADADLAARLLRAIGNARRQQGEAELALEAYDASLEIARAAGLHDRASAALNAMAATEHYRGHSDTARHLYERALVLAMEAGDTRLTALIAQNLGTLAAHAGDAAAAAVAYENALRHYEAAGDPVHCIAVLNLLGMARLQTADRAAAAAALDEAFRLADLERDAELLGTVELNRARLRLASGDAFAARESCDRAYEYFGHAGSRLRVSETLFVHGRIFAALQRPGLAEDHLERAAGIAAAGEYRLVGAEIALERAALFDAQNRVMDAVRQLNTAYRLLHELRERRELPDYERRMDALEAAYLRTLQRWAESIDAVDPCTAGHCERVAELTSRIAASLGYQGRDLAWIRLGAVLHDVGKVNVPAAVLNKPGKLNAAEWVAIRRHSADGEAIVAALELPFPVRAMVRSHHERLDGTGYPDGLAGDSIPLTARILFAADVFDALTTARSYRPALSTEEALRIMVRDVGTAFDPRVFGFLQSIVAPAPTVEAAQTR